MTYFDQPTRNGLFTFFSSELPEDRKKKFRSERFCDTASLTANNSLVIETIC